MLWQWGMWRGGCGGGGRGGMWRRVAGVRVVWVEWGLDAWRRVV